MSKNMILGLVTLAGLAAAAPTRLQQRGVADVYNNYRGDGTTGAGWPDISGWGSFDELWNANLPLMQQSCGWNGWGADNSGDEINNIRDAIQQVSSGQGVDSRFVLAVMMQESKGCVRVPTTFNGVTNPGLLQSHNGSGSCAGVNPCGRDQIFQMITDGVAGTSFGDGLHQTLNTAAGHYGGVGSAAYYAAARLYNSGSVDYSNLNNGFSSVACYSDDVANRLTGWTLSGSNCSP
ncbi:putative glycoside hydrolase protein [Rosellinia necatrix]|uniref:Putative glycoside hydrolase protein n=1 Tax=Rosellinia necatrix TaxID=77044 RepID=A0A1W2TXA3_ROSNE|nr:putative glycoside hydrolase protein [Rosellinia necatrix]